MSLGHRLDSKPNRTFISSLSRTTTLITSKISHMTLMIRGVDQGQMDLGDPKRVKDENFGDKSFLLLILVIVNIDMLTAMMSK